jgi:hypothetical protein
MTKLDSRKPKKFLCTSIYASEQIYMLYRYDTPEINKCIAQYHDIKLPLFSFVVYPWDTMVSTKGAAKRRFYIKQERIYVTKKQVSQRKNNE